jgi:hypothetical protein
VCVCPGAGAGAGGEIFCSVSLSLTDRQEIHNSLLIQSAFTLHTTLSYRSQTVN